MDASSCGNLPQKSTTPLYLFNFSSQAQIFMQSSNPLVLVPDSQSQNHNSCFCCSIHEMWSDPYHKVGVVGVASPIVTESNWYP
mmetsp:Transcript_35916/g.55241  ORF Transcript_35916/g.55241 Transcript_35916/m.55241 type:complete len:84 (+) Transcript_35916:170-421(+)